MTKSTKKYRQVEKQKIFGLENFRIIKDSFEFDLAPLTILTGTNSSGKSTIMNAFQLLKENFKNYKTEEETYKNIDQIFDKEIDVHSLLKRYGKLDQFLSKETGKDTFSFSFRLPMVETEDEMDVSCTIKIEDNEIKTGRIIDILAVSHKSGEEILHIYLAPQKEKMEKELKSELGNRKEEINHLFPVMRINISYFVQSFKDLSAFYYSIEKEVNEEIQKCYNHAISKDKLDRFIEDLNQTHGVDFSVRKNNEGGYSLFQGSKWIRKKAKIDIYNNDFLVNNGIYDFSKMFEKDSNISNDSESLFSFYSKASEFFSSKDSIEDRFESILSTYYKTSFEESLGRFQEDLISFLSSMEWVTNFPDYISEYENLYSPLGYPEDASLKYSGLSFKRFLELYTNLHDNHNVYYNTFKKGSITPKTVIKEHFLQTAIEQNPDFYYRVLKPFLSLICESGIIVKHDRTNWYKWVPSQSFSPTETEKKVYQTIYKNIDLIASWFSNLKEVDILPSARITPKRVYSLDDTDLFTRLIRFYYTDKRDKDKWLKDFIDKWLQEFGLGDSFRIEHDSDSGNFRPYLIKGESKTLLADLGYGTLQILPMIFMLASKYETEIAILPENRGGYDNRFLLIEEPEANLHPALQSKLADMFTEAIKKFNLQLIVETHSEYLIRKLQYLTVKEKVDKDSINIYYFYPPREKKEIQKINIREDGSLNHDFGSGFFDVADNIATDIWDLVYSKNN